MLKHVSEVKEFDELIKNDFVLVDFYADWCGPCKMLSPIVDKVAGEHEELTVLKVNTDNLPEVAARYRVSAIPTLVLIKKGETISQTMGFMNEERLLSFLGL